MAKKRQSTSFREPERKADAERRAAKRLNQSYKEMENAKKRQRRKERAKQPLTEEQKAQKQFDRLKKNQKNWAKAAALRNVSKTPSLPFDESKHKIITECIESVEKAKSLDQRTRNEDGSHQANVCCV